MRKKSPDFLLKSFEVKVTANYTLFKKMKKNLCKRMSNNLN